MPPRNLLFLNILAFLLPGLLANMTACGQELLTGVNRVMVGSAWAKNSVNAVIFRKNSITSHGKWLFIAYYDEHTRVVVGKRKTGSKKWQLHTTPFKGNTTDAHNSISIMLDGNGYLHMAWDHHGNRLHYTRSKSPYETDMMDEMPMTGMGEGKVTYPEFFRMPDGNLVFMYRDGSSGSGNLVINQYDTKTQKWSTLHNKLIDGEGKRNAYWQACVDAKGIIHVSWVWRESPDVASNHDLCYARSMDGGKTWQQSTGKPCHIPITESTAEYAARIPQKSELINQTSMTTDADGNPMIATYWKNAGESVPQYRVVHYANNEWKIMHTEFRTTPFSLSGVGSKFIPISRPQILSYQTGQQHHTIILFRDAERSYRASMAIYNGTTWTIRDWDALPLGAWEPTYDTNLWQAKQKLHLFAQPVIQIDGEGLTETAPTMVEVWEWNPKKSKLLRSK